MKYILLIISILSFLAEGYCQKRYKLNFGDTTFFSCDTTKDESQFVFCNLKEEKKNDGTYLIFREGKLYKKFKLKNKQLNGILTYYDTDGKLGYESLYKNDTIIKNWDYWTYSVVHKKQISRYENYTYDKDGNESIEFNYFDNWGRKELHGYYFNDKKHGEWKIFNLEGNKVIAIVHFNNGKVLEENNDYEIFKKKFKTNGYFSFE